jgi:hypothetical protein
MIAVSMPVGLQLIIGGMFGPALAFASVGLLLILRLHRDRVTAHIAVISNVMAGLTVTAMIVVQLAIRASLHPEADESARLIVDHIWDVVLGLDVTFDIFVGIGTLLFGVAMLGHPRFGRIVGIAGIVVAGVLILGFNSYSFPTPPKDAGLIDPGPISGLWYLWVVFLAFRSFGWIDKQLEIRASAG